MYVYLFEINFVSCTGSVVCSYTRKKHISTFAVHSYVSRVSYHSLGIDKQLYMYIPVFVMYHLFSLVHPQAKHTFSAQLCNRLAQLCIMYHGLCSVICSLWENESLQLYNFMAFLKNEALIKTEHRKLSLVPTFSSKRVNVVP